MINALYDLCAHPESITAIRDEWQHMLATTQGNISKQNLMQLHKLDSFIRETQRINPGSLFVMIRYITSDSTLTDGTLLPMGSSIAAPLYAMNRDPVLFEDPEKFDPERFEKLRMEEANSVNSKLSNGLRWTLTHSDALENANFGYGKHACPGRFLAASEVNAVLILSLQTTSLSCPPLTRWM